MKKRRKKLNLNTIFYKWIKNYKMGCSESRERRNPITKLMHQQGETITSINTNNRNITQYEKEISNYDIRIKQGEDDIKLNKNIYSELEMKSKAKKLLDIRADRERTQKLLDTVRAYNETLKNNLAMIKAKIEEERNKQSIEESNKLMKKLGKENTADVLQTNVNNLMVEQEKADENKRILEDGNRAINSDLGILNEEDYLKKLLGK